MKHGADPAFVDAEGLACIHVAAQFGHTAVIAYFIAKGVDLNVQDVNGLTPLMHCTLKHLRLVYVGFQIEKLDISQIQLGDYCLAKFYFSITVWILLDY